MRKLILALVFCTSVLFNYAQSNLSNSGFEQWDNLGAASEEPANWNSFKTGTGSYTWAASQQLKRSTSVRPGSSGSYSAVMWSKSVLGIIANGCLTTGQVNMGNAAPANSSNYNITQTGNSSFNQTFTASPDSLVVWVRFHPVNSGSNARFHAIIHDVYGVRDPIDGGSTPHIRAEATLNFPGTSGSWVRKSVPFVYSGPTISPNYMLVTFTTNQTPGQGGANDSLYVDDIEMIYDANLNSLTTSEGTLVPGFAPNVTDYTVTLPFGSTLTPTVNATTESSHATLVITPATDITSTNTADKTTTVVVTGGDGTTTKTYHVVFNVALSTDASLSYLSTSQGTLAPVFHSDTLSYTVELPHGTVLTPTSTATTNNPAATATVTDATDVTSAVPATRTTTIHVTAPDGLTTRDYSILFNVNPLNNDATLSAIKVDGSALVNFHPDTIIYNVTLPHSFSHIPVVEGVLSDTNATDTVYQATSRTGSAVIHVVAEDGTTSRTYTVTFFLAPPATDATLRDLRVNDTTIAGFSSATHLYTYYVPVGTVNAPTVTATPTDTNAYLLINQATGIPGQTEVNVFAEDSSTIITYIVNFAFSNGIINYSQMHVNIFPNPATDYIQITSELPLENTLFKLSDLNGKILLNTILHNGSNTINIKNIPSGLYFYSILSDKQNLVRGNIQICR